MNEIPFIDLHSDALMQSWFRRKKEVYSVRGLMSDVVRMRQGGAKAQLFAIYMQSMRMKRLLGPFMIDDDAYIKKLMKTFYTTLERHAEEIAFAGSAEDMQKNAQEGKLSAFLTMEDGRAVQGKMEKLHRYYEQGVRVLGFTWNYENCFGYPNSTDPTIMEKGLKPFGKEAVAEMNRMHMLIDVSHLSDGGFWDVARLSTQPFIASHSNARALCGHSRNLTDEMIRAVGEAGGVIGMNQCPRFLREDSKKNSLADMAAHIRHIIQVGGRETAALGGDFDGITGTLVMKGPQDYQMLAEELRRSGSSEQEIEDIFFRNAERVLGELSEQK